jgi:hypothetical protein
VNRVLPASIVENIMAAIRALGNALSLSYLDFMVAFLAAESGSFADLFTGKNCHVTLQFFSVGNRTPMNEQWLKLFLGRGSWKTELRRL